MRTSSLAMPSADRVRRARDRIRELAVETPLVRLDIEGANPAYAKLENLQPVGSFKIRCAANALLARGQLSGVETASAGNFAQGLAYAGRAIGVPVRTFVPETAASSKLDALRRLGAEVVPLPFAQWWNLLTDPPASRAFIHPVVDPEVLAGNATIGLEVLEQLPAVEHVLTPWGGGGLSLGIAAALAGSAARIIPCETSAGTPLAAALAAGRPVDVDFDSETFITGMGGPTVLPAIWPLIRGHIDSTLEVTVAETAAAVRFLAERHHVIAEGAGAAPVAAAIRYSLRGASVCVVSGGHLDTGQLVKILQGATP